MSKRSIKKWALLLTFWIALHTAALRAQSFAIPFSLTQSSPAVVFSLDSYGILMSTGTENGTAVLSSGEQGAGTRLLWYPGKAAFRAGYVWGTQWNDTNIGNYSVAFGSNTTASGNYSTALGDSSMASNFASTAMGVYATASGSSSVAMGDSTTASGYASMAMGAWAMASNLASTAMGDSTTASGIMSTAMGYATTAGSYDSFAVGRYNVNQPSGGGTVTPGSWVSADPLFEVGNGTGSSARADALVVYKNGVVAVHNIVRFNAGGDLSMGSFTAGTAP
jgi:hypothetical protein